MNRRQFIGGALALASLGETEAFAAPRAKRYYKGNMHMHSVVSDGWAFPQEAAELYRRLGYHFVMLSDHNRAQGKSFWLKEKDYRHKTFSLIQFDRFAKMAPSLFPKSRVGDEGKTEYLVPSFSEIEQMLNRKDEFLVMNGCEFNNNGTFQVHVQSVNSPVSHVGVYLPGSADTTRQMFEDWKRQTTARGDDSIFVVNHPLYWYYDVNPEILADNDEIGFIEVSPSVLDLPPPPDVPVYTEDDLWDYALAKRLSRGGKLLYATSTDDTHDYWALYDKVEGKPFKCLQRRPLCYVCVRADRLTPSSLLASLRAGDFYASTGVDLKDVSFQGGKLTVQVRAEKGAKYRIDFIGTKKDADLSHPDPVKVDVEELCKRAKKPFAAWVGKYKYVAQLPKACGRVLASVEGTTGTYRLRGDELYVRAKVYRLGTDFCAWIQPVKG